MSKSTLPRVPNGHRYCWSERSGGGKHCTLQKGHSGRHWHAYSKTSW